MFSFIFYVRIAKIFTKLKSGYDIAVAVVPLVHKRKYFTPFQRKKLALFCNCLPFCPWWWRIRRLITKVSPSCGGNGRRIWLQRVTRCQTAGRRPAGHPAGRSRRCSGRGTLLGTEAGGPVLVGGHTSNTTTVWQFKTDFPSWKKRNSWKTVYFQKGKQHCTLIYLLGFSTPVSLIWKYFLFTIKILLHIFSFVHISSCFTFNWKSNLFWSIG